MGVEENVEYSQKGLSVVQIILGGVMLGIGNKYMPIERLATREELIANVTTHSGRITEEDPCPNGAAYFLYVSGIISLVTALVHVLTRVWYHISMRDNHMSGKEACLFWSLRVGSVILFIAEIVIVIWGSVVVFGAWAHWTDDYKLHAEHPDEYNYCPHEPMMCAFVILLLKWVCIPALFVCAVCCVFFLRWYFG